jgi:hypothetical protein
MPAPPAGTSRGQGVQGSGQIQGAAAQPPAASPHRLQLHTGRMQLNAAGSIPGKEVVKPLEANANLKNCI